jgi:hypothetical protein
MEHGHKYQASNHMSQCKSCHQQTQGRSLELLEGNSAQAAKHAFETRKESWHPESKNTICCMGGM